MVLEHLIIKLFLSDTEVFSKYFKYIGLKHNSIYTKIYHAIKSLKEDSSDSHSEADLLLKIHVLYPVLSKAEGEALEEIGKRLSEISITSEQASELFAELRKRKIAEDIAVKAVEIASGNGTLSDVAAILEQEKEDSLGEETDFVCDDIVAIRDAHLKEPPFRFRLKTLNRILGGLRRKTFGFLFARPEMGKTTFLVSEATYIAEQVPSCILWVNNEEDGTALIPRTYQATLRKTTQELYKNAEASRDAYKAKIGGKIKIYDKPTASTGDIESVVRMVKPDVVFIDQLDKVRGVKADREDLRLKAIYQWARELAKKYNCAVVGICQAGGTAEGKRFLDMNDVDSSHTAKQGEADWMFGLGSSSNSSEADRRFISTCKNKLPATPEMDSAMRHGKVPVRILPEIQIYEDVLNV